METYRVTVDDNGVIRWYKPGTCLLHRLDGPATQDRYGNKWWFKGGFLHRLDGPAVEKFDEAIQYYIEGEKLTEQQFLARTQPKPNCDGKTVEIEGRIYVLKLQEQ